MASAHPHSRNSASTSGTAIGASLSTAKPRAHSMVFIADEVSQRGAAFRRAIRDDGYAKRHQPAPDSMVVQADILHLKGQSVGQIVKSRRERRLLPDAWAQAIHGTWPGSHASAAQI